MLQEKLNEAVTEAVRDGLLDAVVGKGEKRVSFLARGEYNINYRLDAKGRSYVLRFNTGSQIPVPNQIEYEYRSLQIVSASGVTPHVFFFGGRSNAVPYPWLLMEFLEGRPVEYERDADTVARLLAAVHAVKIPAHSHFLKEENIVRARFLEGERWLGKVWESPFVPDESKEVFREARQKLLVGLPRGEIFRQHPIRTINNTELNSHNFLIGEEKSYVIDWEKPVLSDPVQDLVHFWAPTSTLWKTKTVYTEAQKEAFLMEYEKHAPADPHRREKIRIYTPYLYWRAFTWCASAMHEYNRPDRRIRNEDTLRTLERYLNPAFMRAVWNF